MSALNSLENWWIRMLSGSEKLQLFAASLNIISIYNKNI